MNGSGVSGSCAWVTFAAQTGTWSGKMPTSWKMKMMETKTMSPRWTWTTRTTCSRTCRHLHRVSPRIRIRYRSNMLLDYPTCRLLSRMWRYPQGEPPRSAITTDHVRCPNADPSPLPSTNNAHYQLRTPPILLSTLRLFETHARRTFRDRQIPLSPPPARS